MIPGFGQLLLVCGLVFVVILALVGSMLRWLHTSEQDVEE